MTTGELAWGNCLPGKLPPRENSAGVRLFTDLVDFYRSGAHLVVNGAFGRQNGAFGHYFWSLFSVLPI